MKRRDLLKTALILPAVPSLLSREVFAQDTANQNTPWLEAIAKQVRDEFNIPALWLSGTFDGNIAQAAVGEKKIESGHLASLDDRLMIASITKPMVAVWIASIVETGKLSYDITLLEVVPELTPSCNTAYSGVTLRELLTHTSGITDDKLDAAQSQQGGSSREMRIRIARNAVSNPARKGLRGQSNYSNSNYTLAGLMAENATGIPYEQGITDFYRKRFGLTSFTTEQAKPEMDADDVWLHEYRKGIWHPRSVSEVAHYAPQPSSGVRCAIADMTRFVNISARGHLGETKVCSEFVWKSAFKNGWSVGGWGDIEQIGFGGSLWQGVTCQVFSLPSAGISLAVHLNGGALYANNREGKQIVDGCQTRARELVLAELRHRRGQQFSPRCRVALSNVLTVDAAGQQITPRRADGKVRVAIEIEVQGERTGDIQITAQLGEETREANYVKGLPSGRGRRATFEWDMPNTNPTPFVAVLDASRSCGDPNPEGKRFEAPLTVR